MTPAELQTALVQLNLSPASLAKLLGVDVRTARRWATGGKPIPENVATQLAAMVEAGGVPEELIEQRRSKDSEPVARFLWVRRKDEPEWVVAEHDMVAEVFYLPGRVERYVAGDLVLGPVVEAPVAE